MAGADSSFVPTTIKNLDRLDIAGAVTLFEAQMREHEMPSHAEELRKAIETVLADPGRGFILVASADERLLGVAYAATLMSLEHAGTIGSLEELYVLPESRGCGIGGALIDEVLSRARRLGWKGVELEVTEGHERAGRLYVRHGFQLLSRQRYAHPFSR